MHLFEKTMWTGFRCRSRPRPSRDLRTADDFTGVKLRVLPAPIFVDLFRTLGASPVPIEFNEVYTSLQTRIVDGQESPIPTIEGAKFYEVQRYLSISNHTWSGTWFVANAEAFAALPSDLQTILARNAAAFALRERNDVTFMTDSITDKLRRQGLAVNTCDAAGMRARLGPYYARLKERFGAQAWSMLEEGTGKLV